MFRSSVVMWLSSMYFFGICMVEVILLMFIFLMSLKRLLLKGLILIFLKFSFFNFIFCWMKVCRVLIICLVINFVLCFGVIKFIFCEVLIIVGILLCMVDLINLERFLCMVGCKCVMVLKFRSIRVLFFCIRILLGWGLVW